MCEMGLACQESGCRFGHPREWACFGCEKCHFVRAMMLHGMVEWSGVGMCCSCVWMIEK